MAKAKILWVDDEIDLLKPHIIFLEEKEYEVKTCNNGDDAIDCVKSERYDLVLLDEDMPGMSGLEVLADVKTINPLMPVIMITKHEEENIMEEAIGAKIDDYLIKPVNPKQILISIKKNLERRKLVTSKTITSYQSEFSKLSMQISECRDIKDWKEVYKKLVYWELELERSNVDTMGEVLEMQKTDANNFFSKYIQKNYLGWIGENRDKRPVLSPDLLKLNLFPKLNLNDKYVFILIDNLRYDQWLTLYPMISEYYHIENEELYTSILPTATQYARNSIFSGLMPDDIANIHPDYWVDEEEEEGKNLHEESLIAEHLKRFSRKESFYYYKILNSVGEQKIVEEINDILNNDLIVLVYNFIDILSHARTEIKAIRELSHDESAYRSLSASWFQHSGLFELIKILSEKKIPIAITTDHGSINVTNPVKVIGERRTNSNLRYKIGRNLNYNPKEVFEIVNPKKVKLPLTSISNTYIFTAGKDFFAYPNNYNHYVSYYKNTFQHGGISLEEMLIPYITLNPRE